MDRKAALRRVLFLKTLPEAARDVLAEAGEERVLCKGELLFAEHDRCLGLLVVLTGAVKVYKLDNRGREFTLERETPGQSVAEMPLFDGGNYPASAEAAEDGTRVLIVGREQFRRAMAVYPEIAEQGLKAMAVRMRRMIWMLEVQTLHTVRARLADYLLRVAGERETFRLEETNETIASQIGTVREVVSRTLRGFADAGAITTRGRWITICDPFPLCRLAVSEHEEPGDSGRKWRL